MYEHKIFISGRLVTLLLLAAGAAAAQPDPRGASDEVNLHSRAAGADGGPFFRHRFDNHSQTGLPTSRTVQHETTLVSRASGTDGVKGDGESYNAAISGDGRYIVFGSGAGSLHPEAELGARNVFVRDLQTNETILVSRASGADGAPGNSASFNPSISANGRYVSFHSIATNLHPDDADAIQDVFVRDLHTHETILVSRASGIDGVKGDWHTTGFASLSDDGRYVAFASMAFNLHPVIDDPFPIPDIFVRDLLTNETLLISRASGEHGAKGTFSTNPSISGDGRYVAFDSAATNLHPDDVDAIHDVFVRDLHTHETILVSRANGAHGQKGNSISMFPSISGDGRVVAFSSHATNIHPHAPDGIMDVFVRDRATEETTLVSRASGAGGDKSNGESQFPSISSDGLLVAFQSTATNLHPDDTDDARDIFLRNLRTQETTLISRASGAAGPKGNSDSIHAAVSPAGRYVAFDSLASNLHPHDPDVILDVFLRDLLGPLVITPDPLDFSDIPVGEDSGPRSLSLTHAGMPGAQDVTISGISTPASPFAFASGTCGTPPFTLSPGDHCTLNYTFSPVAPGPAQTTVSVNSDTAGSPHHVTLQGTGTSRLALVPESLDFGGVHVGEMEAPLSATLANVSEMDVTVSEVSVPESPFELAGGDCGPVPFMLAPGTTCTLEYRFAPTLVGPFAATVSFEHDGPTGADSLSLLGTGLPARAVISLDPGSLWSTLEQGQTETQSLAIANLGAAVLDWEVTEDPGGPTAVTHSKSLDVQNRNTVTCGGGTQQFLRAFTLSDFGITSALDVTEVTFGIESLMDTAPISINLYTLEGPFVYANLTLIGSTTEVLSAQSLSLVTFPMTGTAPAGSTVVVEIATPDLTGGGIFIPGSNNLGETAPSYVAAGACGAPQPTPFSELPDCPTCSDVHLVMTVSGSLPDCTLPDWMSLHPPGGPLGGGATQVVDAAFDASNLPPEVYTALLCVASNDPDAPVTGIPIELTVEPLTPVSDDIFLDRFEPATQQ